MQLMNGHSEKVQDRVTGYLMKNPKASAKEIARAVGTTQSNVYNYTAKARKMVGATMMPGKKGFWTPYAQERLNYWYKTGKSFGQIAKLLSKELDARVSTGAVSGMIYRLKHKEEPGKEHTENDAATPTSAPAPTSISVSDPTPVPESMRYQVGGDHYKDSPIQPWAAMEAWMGGEQFVGFLRGNVIKYVARCDKKGGVEDLKKARHYLTKLIEICGGAPDAGPNN